jgi:hypothetical protein
MKGLANATASETKLSPNSNLSFFEQFARQEKHLSQEKTN